MTAVCDVIVAGHICFDVIPRLFGSGEDFFRAFKPGKLVDIGEPAVSTGGPVSNTGIGLLKLGVRTGLMGKVGTDFFGKAILDRLREMGLERSMTVVEGEHTSYTLAITPPGTDRIFLHSRGTNNTFGCEDVNFDAVAAARVFHFGYPPLMKRIYEHGAAELTRIFRRAKEVGVTTSLDMALPDPSSPAGREDWDAALRRTLPFVDLYLPSGEETLFMLDRPTFTRRRAEAGHADVLDTLHIEDLQTVADRALAYGAKVVVLKCGHLGMYLRTAPRAALAGFGACPPADLGNWAGRELWEPAFHVEDVASATGSGDSAIAGFLAAYVRGLSLEECLKYGCAVGAFNVMAFDAVSGIRSWEETTAAIRRGWPKNPVPLVERAAGWRRDATTVTWHGPRDGRA
ncbi:MAG: putative sugar kinase YdjH [Lentisphaerae bacterium ADurb.BinA184]|nr:MAG: putative sugar kinase YdjH [Lentisphaerae bacterium ADurb.BinA184]